MRRLGRFLKQTDLNAIRSKSGKDTAKKGLVKHHENFHAWLFVNAVCISLVSFVLFLVLAFYHITVEQDLIKIFLLHTQHHTTTKKKHDEEGKGCCGQKNGLGIIL